MDDFDYSATGICDTGVGIDEANTSFVLFQNDPNPFQYSTDISYLVPSEIQRAEILVTDHNGRVIKRIEVHLKKTYL